MRKNIFKIIFLCLIISISCNRNKVHFPVEDTRLLMDTVVRVAVYDSPGPENRIRKAIDSAFEIMKMLEDETSSHIDTSDVCKLNGSSGIHGMIVHKSVLNVLKRSIEISEQTDGFFDITIGAVKNIWPFEQPDPKVPSKENIKRLLKFVNFRNISIAGDTVFLEKRGMSIDLGGVAKGYIIDAAVKSLEENGVKAGIVDAGGDLRIFGKNPEKEKWKIGIINPRKKSGLSGVIYTDAKSIATSGDYERYFMYNGVRYHHILNPFTGFPARGCVSVTIITDTGMNADALATAVFVMGHKRGLEFIEKKQGVEGIIMYEDKGVLKTSATSGIKDNYSIIETGR